jgi:hypothetical protein
LLEKDHEKEMKLKKDDAGSFDYCSVLFAVLIVMDLRYPMRVQKSKYTVRDAIRLINPPKGFIFPPLLHPEPFPYLLCVII